MTTRNSNIDIYFKSIRKEVSLNKEDEINLFTRISKGDSKAVDEICRRMAKYAVSVANEYTNDPILLEDLIQEANYGVMLAIPKFDMTMGYRFISIARYYMKMRIARILEEMNVVSPKNTTNLMFKARNVRAKFYNEYGREPESWEVLEILENMGEKVNDIHILMPISISSIDQEISSDEDETVENTGEFAEVTASQNDCLKNEDKEDINFTIDKLMFSLDEREKRFVKMNYGIGYDFPMDYDAIARKESERTGKSITSERVRQIVVGAIKKMKK